MVEPTHFEKYATVKLDRILPKDRGEHRKNNTPEKGTAGTQEIQVNFGSMIPPLGGKYISVR